MIGDLATLLRERAGTAAGAVALVFEGRTIAFGELDRRSNRMGHALRDAGVGPTDRVAFLGKNGPEYFEVLFGSAKVNTVLVAVNWRLAPNEIAHIVNDSGARLLIVSDEYAEAVAKIEAELVHVARVVVYGDDAADDPYEGWVAAQPEDDPGGRPDGDDVALQLYTSGTTGLPKGAMLSHRGLFFAIDRLSERWGFTPASVSLVAMPLFHMSGIEWALMSLLRGSASVVLRDVDMAKILEVIPRYGVTHALLVPSVMQFLLATPGIDTTDFSTLGRIIYGASPISDTLLERFTSVFHCDFIQAYGLTESGGPQSELDPADHRAPEHPHRLRSIGRPYPWIEMMVVDPANGTPLPTGEVGEIQVRSGQNMVGYWGQPGETAVTLTEEGWLRTGDAAYFDEDGYLYLHDRIKDMVVSGGENVFPAEVENVLMAHPGVGDVAVIGVPHDRWGETVKAVVIRDPSEPDLDESSVITFARERLAHYKCPTSVDFVDELPRNASGKLLKRELRKPYWVGRERHIS